MSEVSRSGYEPAFLHCHGSEEIHILTTIQFSTWVYDGGADVHEAFALSGEPIAPQVVVAYGTKPSEPFTASQIAKNNVAQREYQKEYMDYWNSTQDLTGTGRPVDAIISPLAPYPAARREKYHYYGP